MGFTKWVVVHVGARDQYQLPIALLEGGVLDAFITDWYWNPANGILQRVLRTMCKAELGLARHSPLLPCGTVRDMKYLYPLQRALGSPSGHMLCARMIGAFAGRYASERKTNILSTSYNGWSAFREYTAGGVRGLFQVHPHPVFLRGLYRDFMGRSNLNRGLEAELELQVSESVLREWALESSSADFVLTASSFTKRTLIDAGIRAERVVVVPYGVDHKRFRPLDVGCREEIRLLFVGQRTARKGAPLLLAAWAQVMRGNARLVFVGRCRGREHRGQVAVPYEEISDVAEEQMARVYNEADLLVLPSLAEGFGHVILESLACGTPVLTTENTAGSDLITHGVNGFMIPPNDIHSLASTLQWAVSHPEVLREMRSAATNSAAAYTWERFRALVRSHLSPITL